MADDAEIHVGNAAADTADRGWLLGHFMPVGDARRTGDVEVKWGVHPEGEERAAWAADDGRSTLSVLVSGQFRIDLADRSVLLAQPGDYLLYRGAAHTWRAEQASVVIVVRWPSGLERRQDWSQASRSALMVAASVVGMPCG